MTITPPDPWPVEAVTTYPLAQSRRGDGTVTRAEGPLTAGQLDLAEQTSRRRDECIDNAGQVLANGWLTQSQMTAREQAEGAWHPGSRFTVDELEDQIRIERGLPPIQRGNN